MRRACCTGGAARAAGAAVGLAGAGLVVAGAWARREVRRGLERERIVGTPDTTPPSAPVRSAGAARALAEVIRKNTLAAAGGRTYAEVDPYVAADGGTTVERARALVDERTGAPVESVEHALWVQSTALQTALLQAYLAFRLAEVTAGVGAALAAAGAGIAAAARRP